MIFFYQIAIDNEFFLLLLKENFILGISIRGPKYHLLVLIKVFSFNFKVWNVSFWFRFGNETLKKIFDNDAWSFILLKDLNFKII